MTTSEQQGQRISPLRGGMSREEIVNQTKIVKNGLGSLRDDHYSILASIRDDYENHKNQICNNNTVEVDIFNAGDDPPDHDDHDDHVTKEKPSPVFSNKKKINAASSNNDNTSLLEDRISHVTSSLEQLEVGLAESNVLLSLHDHFERLEADRSTLRLEMGRVQDENEWLRDELNDTQRQLQDALAELAGIKEEKKQWQFQEELRNMSETVTVRPMTPSKIPVGSFRVEAEKDINRALNGGHASAGGGLPHHDQNRSRASSPAPSKIPIGGWRGKLSVYKSVMEKQETAKEAAKKKTSSAARKGNYFKLNAPSRLPKVPTR